MGKPGFKPFTAHPHDYDTFKHSDAAFCQKSNVNSLWKKVFKKSVFKNPRKSCSYLLEYYMVPNWDLQNCYYTCFVCLDIQSICDYTRCTFTEKIEIKERKLERKNKNYSVFRVDWFILQEIMENIFRNVFVDAR